MERRRESLPALIFFLLMAFVMFTSMFELPFYLFITLLVVLIAIVLIVNLGYISRKKRPRTFNFEGMPFKLKPSLGFKIGKWVIIPIAFCVLIGFILFQNWWLTVKILQSMFSEKALLNWWNINFLNNYYFYACISIGLLVALSDPRIIITKDIEGKRKIYLHSKLWGVIKTVFSQIFGQDGFLKSFRKTEWTWDDKISFKRGIVWKLVEFLGGTFLIGPRVAQELALRYLIIAQYIETQSTSWITIIQRSFSILYTRLFTSEMPTGEWLLENSIILEFLTFIRIPILIFGTIWAIRLVISFIFNIWQGKITASLRYITMIGLIILTPILLNVPTQVFDITTPLIIRSIVIGEIVLIALTIFFSLHHVWVQRMITKIYKQKIILATLAIIVLGSVFSGPIVVAFQYSPALQGHWEDWVWTPKYLPTVEYTRWATGLEAIEELQITAAMDTGENLDILSNIRIFNDAAAKLRLKGRIGVNWMDFGAQPDIIMSGGKEYWIAPLTIVPSEIGSAEDKWREQRMLRSHSERILVVDAANGEIVPLNTIFNRTSSVSIYYGEGGLFASSDIIYIDVPNFPETHLPDYQGPASYIGEPDFVLTGFDRLWFFSGIYGQEVLRWDFGRGDWGDVKMLYQRDIKKRLSSILLPGMIIDDDPYIVSDPNGKLYYSLYVYVDRAMPTEYLDYPAHEDRFWRLFATVLIDVYDGSIKGYVLEMNDDNYIIDFYRSMYPQWNQDLPEWLETQLRYPEYLFEQQIDSYNWYHVSDPDNWQKNTDFFELTTGPGRSVIEDTRYITFSLNKTNYWAAVRLVEWYQSPGKNLAGLYVALNQEDIGSVFLIRSEDVAMTGPQLALDTITNYGPTKSLLTLNPNWKSGNIVLYVIGGSPYYFIPFYAETETTLSPTMVVTIDAISGSLGYNVIDDPTQPSEVGSAAAKAYSNLVGAQTELPAEARKEKIINEFENLNYTIRRPQEIGAPIEFQVGSSTFYIDEDWNTTKSLILDFINNWVIPNDVETLLQWETIENGVKYVNIGVLINLHGYLELDYVKIAYTSD